MKRNFVDEKYRSAVIVFFQSIKYRFWSFSHSTRSLVFYGRLTSWICNLFHRVTEFSKLQEQKETHIFLGDQYLKSELDSNSKDLEYNWRIFDPHLCMWWLFPVIKYGRYNCSTSIQQHHSPLIVALNVASNTQKLVNL